MSGMRIDKLRMVDKLILVAIRHDEQVTTWILESQQNPVAVPFSHVVGK